MMLEHGSYLDFVRREYLDGFIREGGAAVKFGVAPDAMTIDNVHTELRATATDAGYVYAAVDAATTKMSMVDQVFHTVAKQVPWRDLARKLVTNALEELRFPTPPGEPLSLHGIARHNQYDYQELRKDFNRKLQQQIFHDYELAQDFRIAMILLCQAEVSSTPDVQATAEAVLAWLRGELRHISQLKPELIYQKIVRSNALHMLYSLGPWLRKAGRAGLVLDFDIRQCAITGRALTDQFFYTKPAVLDVYELLRQLIDATDELRSTFILVSANHDFLADQSRGLERYWALRLRILDEVRDRGKANPYSALIRLTSGVSTRVEVPA
jgi:hypothetical protein